MKLFDEMINGMQAIIFPETCLNCGCIIPEKENFLCDGCAANSFEDANLNNADFCDTDLIYPDGIALHDAMWHYDKKGVLQKMVRMLKYERMERVGLELGRILGRRINKRHKGKRFQKPDEVLLVPVPLHISKKRKRGYNQAFLIARGIQEATGIDIVTEPAIRRNRKTITQTKLAFGDRMSNLRGVFEVHNPEELQGKLLLIVDDVFTTGSTAFSLHYAIRESIDCKTGIITIAKA